MRSTPAWGFPCCIGLPLVYMPPPLPRQNLKECSSLRFLAIAAFPGLITGRLLRLHFGACSAFTRVAACILAGSLNDPFHRRLQPFRYLHGCSDCYRLERKLPGGIRTRWKTVHWHGAHETPVDVQTHDGSGSNHQAYLWQYGTPGGMTVFDFQMSRKREGPFNFLELIISAAGELNGWDGQLWSTSEVPRAWRPVSHLRYGTTRLLSRVRDTLQRLPSLQALIADSVDHNRIPTSNPSSHFSGEFQCLRGNLGALYAVQRQE